MTFKVTDSPTVGSPIGGGDAVPVAFVAILDVDSWRHS